MFCFSSYTLKLLGNTDKWFPLQLLFSSLSFLQAPSVHLHYSSSIIFAFWKWKWVEKPKLVFFKSSDLDSLAVGWKYFWGSGVYLVFVILLHIREAIFPLRAHVALITDSDFQNTPHSFKTVAFKTQGTRDLNSNLNCVDSEILNKSWSLSGAQCPLSLRWWYLSLKWWWNLTLKFRESLNLQNFFSCSLFSSFSFIEHSEVLLLFSRGYFSVSCTLASSILFQMETWRMNQVNDGKQGDSKQSSHFTQYINEVTIRWKLRERLREMGSLLPVCHQLKYSFKKLTDHPLMIQSNFKVSIC